MKLILVRHGQTEENAAGIIQGHLPGKLSQIGIEQAKKAAIRLKDEHIDYIYSSDLARTADTAKAIAAFHPDTPITFTQELREKDLGEWQGKTLHDAGIFCKEDWKRKQPKDGETGEQMFQRAKNFIAFVQEKHPHKTVLLAGHNGINRALIGAITKLDDYHQVEQLKNTCICIYEIDEDNNHTTHLFNCAKHLDEIAENKSNE